MGEKTIYIDVTDILEDKCSCRPVHIFTELISNLIYSYDNILLLYFSHKHMEYILVDQKEYIDFISGDTTDIVHSNNIKIIKPGQMLPYSVFIDISNGYSTVPQRNWLFSTLINLNIQIVSVIPDIQSVTQPHLYEDNDRMRFMCYIMAHLRYAEKIITSPATANEIENLVKVLKTKPKDIITVFPDGFMNKSDKIQAPDWATVSLQILEFLNSEHKIEFNHKSIKQMVFLSARPEPLLNTLPYIFHYMKFIREIVVCCPDKMAEYLKENYHGDIRITVITDSQLLEGHKLPEDHATRNFFLRCLAMQREELDDEFIMSDDDYRPLKEITEDVFFSDGKYNAYYFIDTENWRHTITDIFSYDRSMFKTLEFLKENGYPTLQYSGHQPQVINKKLYQSLISHHSEITTMGYDEWSTYFNFCAVYYRNYFRQLPYITLGWPNVGTVWRHGVKIHNYLFENFYEENYKKDSIFRNLSPGFCELTDKENQIKIQLAQKIYSDFAMGFKEYDSFYQSYTLFHDASPLFSIHCPSGDIDNIVCISAPELYEMKSGVLNEIRFRISRADISICNSNNIFISVMVIDDQGEEYFSVTKKVTPEQTETNCHIDIYKTDKQLTLHICCSVEKITGYKEVSLPLILV